MDPIDVLKYFLRSLAILCLVWLAACSSAQPGIPNPSATTTEITFHPTDPQTVSLEAGKPQFVEFFAFW